MLRFSDARNFGRSLTGLCLIGGPIVLIMAQIVAPNTNHDNKNRELAAVAAHKGSYLLATILFFVGALIMMGAALGLIRFFRGPRGVTLGQVAGTLLLFGSSVFLAFYAFGISEYEMVNIKAVSSPADRAVLATFLDKAENSGSGLPLFILFLVGIVLGSILLAIAMRRTRVVPVWAAVAVLASAITGFGDSNALSFVTFGLLLIGLGTLGRQILGMSDEEWAAPRVRKGVTVGPEAPSAPTPAPAA